jgi:molybdenum cofactor cytidylyltransferase
MGRLKALLPWHGTTLISHQISVLLKGGVDRVIVVLGHRAESLKPTVNSHAGCSWTVNPEYVQGKTTSIKAGLDALADEELAAVLILNVDQPRSPETINEVLRRHSAADVAITIPEYCGKGGHPIVVDPSLLSELRSIDEESQGLKAVVRRHNQSTQRIGMSTPEILWDLNTPEQYQQALQALG